MALAAVMVLSFAACGGAADDGSTDGGNDTGAVTPPEGGNDDPENLVLIKDGKANFRIVYTHAAESATKKVIDTFISDIGKIGVEVDKSISDSSAQDVTDCEIIVGTGVQNRDAKYVLDPHDYGEEGYVIKIVDNKVLIGGGNAEQTKIAFEYFVKNVVKFTNKTKELNDLSLERSYEKLKETKYLIDSITIDGVEISDFVFVADVGDDLSQYEHINGFRDTIYSISGNWLDAANPGSVPEGKPVISVKLVENAGDDGFRAYVDADGNLNVDCAYANAFDLAFESFVNSTFADAIGDVEISKRFEKTLPVSVVYYSQFGAVGDGRTNDATAIYNTHAFANQSGQTVMGDKNATYYIFDITNTAVIMTNVDWNGATFLIEDRGSLIYNQRGKNIFSIASDYTTRTFSASEIHALFADKTIKAGDTDISWLAPYVEGTSFVTFRNKHEDFIRWGGHIMSHDRQDIAIIEPTGKLHDDTPVIWDFEAGEQLVNTGRRCEIKVHTNFSMISIRRVDDTPITIKNGYFTRNSNEVVAETEFQNVYAAYSRGIAINRSNVTIENVDHKILWEPDMPTSGYGQNEKGEFRQGYPYAGFLVFSGTYNSKAVGCDLNAHTCFYEHKDSTATPTAMGSYDLNITGSCNVSVEGITNGVDHCDSQYWGIMHSNESKNLSFKDCTMNRFDAHEGVWNAEFEDCEFGFTINLIGGGYVKMTNVTRCIGDSFISMRVDYGSTFNGTLELIDCTLIGMRGYRGGRPANPSYYAAVESVYVVSSSYATESIYSGVFNYNNMQTFPFLKWDFGYQRYLPQNLIIDNFRCVASSSYGALLYVYPNYADACFVKPDDFVAETDYEGVEVTLPDGTTRPMTEDDVFYGSLKITQSITFRNMDKAIPICPDKMLYLYNYLTPRVTME